MSFIAENIKALKSKLPESVMLVAVSKTKSIELILEAYHAGQKDFGENYVQELLKKQQELPKDIRWHFIGHLQSNKVKYIAPFVHLIHGVDSFKLLKEINKQAAKNNRIIKCLLQIYIAQEETKFGMDENELIELFSSSELPLLKNIEINGLMGMASNTDNTNRIREEFRFIKKIFNKLKGDFGLPNNVNVKTLSIGMSSDWPIAIEEGANIIRVGSAIFGVRNYN